MQKWYPFLVPQKDEKRKGKALLDRESVREGNLIVCWGKEYREYSLFADIFAYRNFFYKTPDREKCFYELILGSKSQKVYFDIDINEDLLLLLESKLHLSNIEEVDREVTSLILRVRDESISFITSLTQGQYPEILVFSSHAAAVEGRRNKMSFHLVINNYCVSSHIQNKIFFDTIKSKTCTPLESDTLEEKVRKFTLSEMLDGKVYTSNRQFRMWGCTKHKSSRFKIIEEELSTSRDGPGEKWALSKRKLSTVEILNEMLLSSLVSYTKRCCYLPTFDEEKINKKVSTYTPSGEEVAIDINDEVAEKVLKLYSSFHELEESPFSLITVEQDESERGIIVCRREHPSYCVKCNRVHEHENCFFIVFGQEMNVLFDCRRHPTGERLFIGKLLSSEKEKEEEKVEGSRTFVGILQESKMMKYKERENYYSTPAIRVTTSLPKTVKIEF